MTKIKDKPIAGDVFYPGFLAPEVWVLIHARTGAFLRKPRPNKRGIRETYTFPNAAEAEAYAKEMGYTFSRGPKS